MTPRAPLGLYAKLAFTSAVWGGQFIVAKFLVAELPPFTGAFLRFLAAAAGLAPVLARAPRLDARQWLGVFVLAAIGLFGYNVFFFGAIDAIATSRAALIMALVPALAALGATLIYGERMTGARAAGIALAFCGATVVITRGDVAALLWSQVGFGEWMMLAGAVCWAASTLIGRVVMRRVPPLVATAYATLVATVLFAGPAAWELATRAVAWPSWKAWASVFYLGVLGTALSFLWFYDAIGRIGPARTAVFVNLVPVFGVAAGVLLLGEPLAASVIIGGLLALAGVALVNR